MNGAAGPWVCEPSWQRSRETRQSEGSPGAPPDSNRRGLQRTRVYPDVRVVRSVPIAAQLVEGTCGPSRGPGLLQHTHSSLSMVLFPYARARKLECISLNRGRCSGRGWGESAECRTLFSFHGTRH